MFAKILISGEIVVVTGLHIGGGNAYSAIGAVDSPVIRDPQTKLPIIPGSSLKGKVRTLLARSYSGKFVLQNCNEDHPDILRLFGSSGGKDDKSNNSESKEKQKIEHSRLQFSDCLLTNRETLETKYETIPTEVKFENTIDRGTSVANPRQIERVIRGAVFEFRVIYDMDDEGRAGKDFEVIGEGIKLLRNDYLGGHGSRGSGRIEFKNLTVTAAYGSVTSELLAECGKKLS
ncbi:MAG: type III-A CRISPR-associated RAMP protein Csm3 [Deferribacteraceae bacterium]|jgi:CRISPR-associated protein Csm3|nr:type III-A CRISPR-associated RAMP protein Csm3 [Deferribacteraceae bacterium]